MSGSLPGAIQSRRARGPGDHNLGWRGAGAYPSAANHARARPRCRSSLKAYHRSSSSGHRDNWSLNRRNAPRPPMAIPSWFTWSVSSSAAMTAQRMEQLRGSRADTQPTTRRSLMPAKPRSRLRTKAGWHAGSATKTAEYVSGRRKPGLPDAVPWFS